MKTTNSEIGNTPQNLGWLDRFLRFIIGTAMITTSITVLFLSDKVPTWSEQGEPMVWMYYVILIAIYPFLTAVLGRDPIYTLFGLKSCGGSPRNPCGTLPFEVDAALGHNPIPDSEIEHSLERSHHK